ncbi:GTP pyrophosphokinase [Desulfatitalea tepidiphila]|uniref:GTP pyrophosphokinase n=1 Tax=Desulfatitalea tepidiphila TaxID=1185843 RepID=UPI0006B64E52|nr:hypothetical protein [Desulfatitalea tepidiphila]
MIGDPLNRVWKENPEYIRRFYDNLDRNKNLCDEVRYILCKALKSAGIDYAHITARAKSLKSFCEKISRKKYNKPFEDITDFAGVRVVYLYSSDRKEIESIIESEFDIEEKVDKVSTEHADRFGYGALHYLLRIKKHHSGARYDDLKNLVCEVQVRTILQDAWAEVAHHLAYKQESDAPLELQRKLNALSGLFETADDQFENIRVARSKYQEKIRNEITRDKELSLNNEINLDSLRGYLSWKFPDRENMSLEHTSELLKELERFDYKKLVELDNAVGRAEKAVIAYEKKYPPTDDLSGEPCKYAAVGFVRAALLFVDNGFQALYESEKLREKRSEFNDLVIKRV